MISVIIPAYNAERTLPYTLRALQNQTVPRELYEVIVVDDASTDGTAAVAREFGVKYRLQNKEGPAAARNLGVRVARGDLILFTDSDCIPREDWIEKMVKPFEDPQVAGVSGRYLTRQKEFCARFVQLEFEERFQVLEGFDSIDLVASFSAAFRRSVFEDVGGFDAHYPLANNEDVELSYKIASRGYRMVFANDAIVYHRHPATWKKYFSIKFSRAFWRILVYKKFPAKILRDTYTPQSLKFQIIFSYLVLLSLAGFFFGLGWGLATAGGALALFVASCVPFVRRTYRFDRQMALAAPLVLFFKSLIFGYGVFLGLIIGSERDTIFPAVLALSDAFMAAAALALGFWVRSLWYDTPLIFSKPVEYFVPMILVFPLIVTLVFRQMGLYRVKVCQSKLNDMALFLRAFAVVALVVMAGMFLLKVDYSRILLAAVFLSAMPLVGLARMALKSLHERMMAKGINATRVLIVGSGETAQMLLEKTHSFPALGYYVVGFVAEVGIGKRYLGKEILGSSRDILKIVDDYQIDEVIFARPNLSREKVLDLIVQLEKADVSIKMVSDLYDIVTSQTVIDGIADIPMVEIHKQKFGRVQSAIKEVLDYLLASLLLLISLPLWVTIAVLIRLGSAGPVLIRDDRIGRKGAPLRIFKFRTLYRQPESGEAPPAGWNDPRVTRFGRFLRRTSLDEWPQLLNILRGEMSLVGPRPELPGIVANYKEWQKLRLEVKPGITGLWQIMGRKDLFLHQNLEYDFYYIKNRSLLLDLSILLRTIPAMVFGASPAYRGWLVHADLEREDFSNVSLKSESKESFQEGARA
ncbi:MAG: exopolysaccharide biosynthesis polyprenyl glycosylphosphotransferase [Candidatus Zixiibacteriota bacterium]|nr:MAG: exopolysaccharide biosynthesis polyprenyl glycosylphosphotransferase [candidate division Zixibacteria bacterium]